MIGETEFSFRPYTPAAESACLNLFDGNTPLFFGSAERPLFENFLQRQPGPFFIVEAEGQVIACGGYCRDAKSDEITLSWGMVRNDLHRQGIGTYLLEERLKVIFHENPAARVLIDTSQHSQAFYARFGFKATHFTPDYYAPGLHRIEMELELTDNLQRRLSAAREL